MNLSKNEIIEILKNKKIEYLKQLLKKENLIFKGARVVPILEISNKCENNCLYCGIRKNASIKRYQMNIKEIIENLKRIKKMGFYHIHLQSGENSKIKTTLYEIVDTIKKELNMTSAASVGPLSEKQIAKLSTVGLTGVFIRFETSNLKLFESINPEKNFTVILNTLKYAKKYNLKIATGFQIGLPGQTLEILAEDIIFVTNLNSDIIGVGPFIPTKNTPFENETNSFDLDIVNLTIGILRLLNPKSFIPATSAYEVFSKKAHSIDGRANLLNEYGANGIMLNITPPEYRQLYTLYDNKIKIL